MLVRLSRNNPTGISFKIYSRLVAQYKFRMEETGNGSDFLEYTKISIQDTNYKVQISGILKHRDLDSPSNMTLFFQNQ